MWNTIKPNSTIALIAPAAKEPIPERIKATIEFFEKKGFKVSVPEGFCTKEHPFHSAEDNDRTNELLKALKSDAEVILCPRGGYGSAKIVSNLLKLKYQPSKEKILIGFSDITALHIYFHEMHGWQPIHGGSFIPYPGTKELRDPRNIEDILDLISGQSQQITVDDLVNISGDGFKEDIAIEGQLHGGNLCLVQTTIGTPYQANFKDKVVFLEDVSERGYRIDRMLNHLLDAGLFEGTRTLVYGEIVDGNEPKKAENLVMYSLSEFAKKVNFPIYQSNSFGHGYKNIPFVYGAHARIEKKGDNISLSYALANH